MLEEKDSQVSTTAMSNATKNITKNNDIIEKDNDIQNYTNAVVVSNATAKWVNNQAVNTIENINLTVKPGGLVAVIGEVGAGKVNININLDDHYSITQV